MWNGISGNGCVWGAAQTRGINPIDIINFANVGILEITSNKARARQHIRQITLVLRPQIDATELVLKPLLDAVKMAEIGADKSKAGLQVHTKSMSILQQMKMNGNLCI